MKRSNRLILLIGVLLAVVAFVGVIMLFGNQDPTDGPGVAPDALPTVFAVQDIPLGVKVTDDMIEARELPVTERDPTAFQSVTLVVGKIARQDIATGAQLVAANFESAGSIGDIRVPQGLRAIAVQVDQISGVGTVIKAGDYVDMVVGLTGDQFPVISVNPDDQSITVVAGLNSTSVKLLVQGMQVLGTLLPPPPAEEGATGDTALTGQQQIVIVGATAQQAEIIKYAQLGADITLVLRSVDDFRDPDTGEEIIPEQAETSGIILKTLVDEYGVLVPELIEAILPTGILPTPTPTPVPAP